MYLYFVLVNDTISYTAFLKKSEFIKFTNCEFEKVVHFMSMEKKGFLPLMFNR